MSCCALRGALDGVWGKPGTSVSLIPLAEADVDGSWLSAAGGFGVETVALSCSVARVASMPIPDCVAIAEVGSPVSFGSTGFLSGPDGVI